MFDQIHFVSTLSVAAASQFVGATKLHSALVAELVSGAVQLSSSLSVAKAAELAQARPFLGQMLQLTASSGSARKLR